eukprot:12892286-Prorocentrum_lima.AAC.1
MATVVSEDELLKKILLDELSEPVLRNPRNLEQVAGSIRIMLGEVRVRPEEDRTAKASREAC